MGGEHEPEKPLINTTQQYNNPNNDTLKDSCDANKATLQRVCLHRLAVLWHFGHRIMTLRQLPQSEILFAFPNESISCVARYHVMWCFMDAWDAIVWYYLCWSKESRYGCMIADGSIRSERSLRCTLLFRYYKDTTRISLRWCLFEVLILFCLPYQR
jgi:hypothetical protein